MFYIIMYEKYKHIPSIKNNTEEAVIKNRENKRKEIMQISIRFPAKGKSELGFQE